MNHAYTLTGLTIGQEYILILDGEAAVASDFYIEIISGADGGCTPPLPIVLQILLPTAKTTELIFIGLLHQKLTQNNMC